jgi:hypothetical protein
MKPVLRLIQRSPYIEAFGEVFFIVLLAIGPLCLVAALSVADAGQDITASAFSERFVALIRKGELSFLTLSACGSIVWILLVKSYRWSWLSKASVGAACISAVVVSSGFIGQDLSLDKLPPIWVVKVTGVLYIGSIIGLYLASWSAPRFAGHAGYWA